MPARPSEDELIARYFAPLAGPAGLGLKDDVALLRPPAGRDLVLTTDALVAGVHFFADDPADAIARKALRVNLSDLAAKGAEPLGFLLDLALPGDWTAHWLEAFAAGLGEDAALYRLPAARRRHREDAGAADAGDHRARRGRSGPHGGAHRRPAGRPALRLRHDRRRRARAAAAAGAGARLSTRRAGAICSSAISCRCRALALAPAMAAHAHGGMDVSDGFVGDLTKMLRVSGVTARVELARLPLSRRRRRRRSRPIPRCSRLPRRAATIMNSSPRSRRTTSAAFEAAAAAAGVAVTLVGEAFAGAGRPQFIGRDGRETAFRHGVVQPFLSLGLYGGFQ